MTTKVKKIKKSLVPATHR